jgi:orotidine-5'-phosphate decarboxylase
MRHFRELVQHRRQGGKLVCVGLDPNMDKIGRAVGAFPWTQLQLGRFFTALVDATAKTAAAFKPNRAFFGGLGIDGHIALAQIIAYIRTVAPEVPVILDPKYGDIGATNDHYVREVFEVFGADAVTIHPYLGREAMAPFLKQEHRGIIVLSRTSNPGAGEFQDLEVPATGKAPAEPLYCRVARNVATEWDTVGNCGVVVGATYPDELKRVRAIVGERLILIPGVGTQGGDLAASVRNSLGGDALINLSSSIAYASTDPNTFAQAAAREAEQVDLAITDILAHVGTQEVGQAHTRAPEGGAQ